MNLIKKVVLVTGASSGIGAAIAMKFASMEANVVLVGRNEKKLNNINRKIEKMGQKSIAIVADITRDDETEEMVNKAIKHHGKLDVLVNNAGIAIFESILSKNAVEVFDQVMAINLRAVVKMTNLTAEHLIRTKGNIVNISSIGSMGVLHPLNFSYCSLKAGLDHFTRCIAFELSKYNVRVNTVNPGPVKTGFMEEMNLNNEEQIKIIESLTNASMLSKLAEPEEIADIVTFLASDLARSVTGSSFVIDNGVLMNGSLGIKSI